jgi:hypothetical protein
MRLGRVTLFILGSVVSVIAFSQLKSPTAAAAAGQSPFAHNFSYVDKSASVVMPADYRDQAEVLGSDFVLDPAGNQHLSSVREEGTILGSGSKELPSVTRS